MNFLGQYTFETKNGRVPFPWEIDGGKRLIWVMAEITNDDGTSVFCEILYENDFEKCMSEREKHVKKSVILCRGDFLVDEDNIWQVPDDILRYLKTDEITFVGGFFCVEIYSREDMEKCQSLMMESPEFWDDTATEGDECNDTE